MKIHVVETRLAQRKQGVEKRAELVAQHLSDDIRVNRRVPIAVRRNAIEPAGLRVDFKVVTRIQGMRDVHQIRLADVKQQNQAFGIARFEVYRCPDRLPLIEQRRERRIDRRLHAKQLPHFQKQPRQPLGYTPVLVEHGCAGHRLPSCFYHDRTGPVFNDEAIEAPRLRISGDDVNGCRSAHCPFHPCSILGPHAQSLRVPTQIITGAVWKRANDLRDQFANAQPFKHVVVDRFFESSFARRLSDEFPQARNASPNLYGAPGKKAFHRDLRALGGAYGEADAYFSSPEFLNWVGVITGIPDLLYDPSNFGGGTHENFEGRDLRPHVDFNYHPVTRLHRRVNVIVYLNEEWQPEWGGSIALYADPREPSERAVEYAPSFNRCIVFETSERSWHGFERISLPANEKHRTRKSLSIYLYTRERPESEIRREHTTFFIPRALPEKYSAGYVLNEDDAAELHELIDQRDHLIELYQAEQGRMESDSAQASRLRMALSHIASHHALPILGYVRLSNTTGLNPDGWTGSALRFTANAERAVRALVVHAVLHSSDLPGATLTVAVDGRPIAVSASGPGRKEIQAPMRIERACNADVEIAASGGAQFFVEQLLFEHTEN